MGRLTSLKSEALHARLPALFTLLMVVTATAKDKAPPGSDRPWDPPGIADYEEELARGNPRSKPDSATRAISPDKIYDLPELIDLAEGNNPQTRLAWERARQAAANVGLAKSEYYPFLAATAASRYERVFEPFPRLSLNPQALPAALGGSASKSSSANLVTVTGSDTLVATSLDSAALVSVRWLLFDFGGREARVAGAREQLMAANISFNSTHQQIVFQVTQLFYAFNVARQQVAVAESNQQSVKTVLASSQARLAQGLSTQVDLLQAEQQAAQSDFDLLTARGTLSDARLSLVNALGILPTTPLRIAEIRAQPRASDIALSIDALVDRALSHRPDLVAMVANVRARREAVRQVRAEYYPKLTLSGKAGLADLETSSNGNPYLNDHNYSYQIVLGVDWTLFDGFARANQLRLAESQLRSAEAELAQGKDAMVREVWQAYTDFKMAFLRQESSARSLAAAEGAFAAALKSYQQGLAAYTDVVNTERAVTLARGLDVQIRANIFTRAAALARAVGDLARPTPSAHTPLPPRPPRR